MTSHRKEAIERIQQRFHEADEFGSTLEQCWDVAFDALLCYMREVTQQHSDNRKLPYGRDVSPEVNWFLTLFAEGE